MQSNKRKLNMLFFLIACVFISVAATKPSGNTNKQISVADTSLFKNLKILPQNISKEDLDKVMHGFNNALGVKCNFCHAFTDGKMNFPSDEKPEKDIARYMLNMTKEINGKYFNSENSTMPDTISVVKCVTCHRGNPHPQDVMMPMNNNGNMPPPPSPGHDSAGKMPPPPGSDSAGKMPPPPPPSKP